MGDQEARKRVNLKLPRKLHRKLRMIAAEKDVTIQHLIERLCSQCVKEHEQSKAS